MDIKEFLEQDLVKSCVKKYKKILKDKEMVEYNVFNISSYNNQLENFHSDVLASLLDPNGLHCEGNKFLILFITFLNEKQGFSIEQSWFENATIHREIGNAESHIDILILGSEKSIIIENKINDAPYMIDQLDRYFLLVNDEWKKNVCGIIYLSLEGFKKVSTDIDRAKPLLKNIGAYEDKNIDLCTGWLFPCYLECTNEDSRSLIFQYIKLIKHLANNSMEKNTIEDYYGFISNSANFEIAKTIIQFTNSIPLYRAKKFIDSIIDHSPYRNLNLWSSYPNICLFTNWVESSNDFKLDVGFHDDGSVTVLFWNIAKDNEDGRLAVFDKIQTINFDTQFYFLSDSKYEKKYTLSEFKSMINIDNEVAKFVNLFLEKLREISNK